MRRAEGEGRPGGVGDGGDEEEGGRGRRRAFRGERLMDGWALLFYERPGEVRPPHNFGERAYR